jgi:type I restriction enzyme S subunit
MSDLPVGWRETTLRELGLPRTPNIDPARFPNEIFELYSVPSFANGRPEMLAGREIKSIKQVVRPGDVLLCKIIPHLVRVWCVPVENGHQQIASGEWIVVRGDATKVCNDYVRYALTEPFFRSQFMETVSGVGGSLMRASPKAVAQIPIVLPPLDDQRRIVAKLGSLFNKSRRAREELEHVPQLVERYKQAVLASAFSGRLTADWRVERKDQVQQPNEIRIAVLAEREKQRKIKGIRSKGANRNIPPDVADLLSLPSGWSWLTFDECCWDLTVGHVGSMKERYATTGIPFLRSLNVKKNRIDLTEVVYIGPDFDQELRKSRLTAGTVVVVRTGAPGVSAVIPPELEGANCSDLVICRTVESLDPHYAAYFINSTFAQEIVAGFQVGVAQQHFNVGAMSKLAIPYAPTEEQKEIVRRIDAAFGSLNKIAKEHARASKFLPKLEETILAKALRGKLVPQEPNKELGSAPVGKNEGRRIRA